jgi:hypothetical protein
LGVLEEAEVFVGLDSVFANLVDNMMIQIPERYWIRRSPWDVTPVLGQTWTMIETGLPTGDPQRVNPTEQAAAKAKAEAARAPSGMTMNAPFAASGQIPTNFMHAVNQKQ